MFWNLQSVALVAGFVLWWGFVINVAPLSPFPTYTETSLESIIVTGHGWTDLNTFQWYRMS